MEKLLELNKITKSFPGVKALDGVSFSIDKGCVHAIVGENGAGKSTLIKIISGALQPEQGEIVFEGDKLSYITPGSAKKLGIGVIYQELSLVPSLTVLENLFLGRKEKGRLGPDKKVLRAKALESFQQLGIANIDPDQIVNTLPIAQQQIIEIVRETSRDTKLLIMDEPSAVLDIDEVERLFQIIEKLKNQGVTIVYISHRMEEIFRLADYITVLRDGRHIRTCPMSDLNRKDIITLMVGRELKESFPARNVKLGEPVLELDNVTGNGDKNISFTLHKGEILGLAGLVGAGRTEIAKVIVGDARHTSGTIKHKGKVVNYKNPGQAAREGIAIIPENRKTEGAILDYPIDWNIGLMSFRKYSKWGFVKKKTLDGEIVKLANRLRIKTPSLSQLVRNLSGGNQQKVVVAKALAADASIVIFDEPTRGIDVGAKQEIYNIMNQMVEAGVSIIMISSEMEEIIGMSDNVVVLHEGRVSGILTREELSQQRILELASGM